MQFLCRLDGLRQVWLNPQVADPGKGLLGLGFSAWDLGLLRARKWIVGLREYIYIYIHMSYLGFKVSGRADLMV